MTQRIILFDGICNFCNFWVNFIIRRDRKDIFRFASLQSNTGQSFLQKFNLPINKLDTFILIEEDRFFTKSTAALRVAKILPNLWKMLYIFIVIPHPLRDSIYNIIALNRYRIFGKRETCRIPTPEERKKFLE